MRIFRTFGLAAAGLLLALSAAAQTPATPRPKQMPGTAPAARAADPLRGTNPNGKGNNVYAAPGEPVIVRDSNKPLHYDGPAAGHAAKAAAAAKANKSTTIPGKQ
ncbi:MAG: hypothetical protein WKG07_18660 [Hymenobacter sp.]